MKQAKKQDRRVVIFVSGDKAPTSRKFRDAAATGDLDGSLGRLAFLEFDFEQDTQRLATAGYLSKVVPSFVVPEANGRPSRFSFEGTGAGLPIAFLSMKVQALLLQTRTGT